MAKRWTPENTEILFATVEGMDVISKDVVEQLAVQLDTSTRSIASKLRKSGHNVESLSVQKVGWTPEQTAELHQVLETNPQAFTYAELAAALSFEMNARVVQGKVLSEELTSLVKATPKKEAVRTYTAEEEVTFVRMAQEGASIDSIAAALGRTLPQVRGKALSLNREGLIDAIPKQDSSVKKVAADAFNGLDVAAMTVDELVAATGKASRSIRSMLTRRGISCSDYDGAAKAAKAAEKKAAVAE